MAFGYPNTAVPASAASANVANAQAQASLAAIPGKTAFVTGFEITAGGATAAALVQATLVGLLGGTATYIVGAPAGATAAATPLCVRFAMPIPASAPNVALTLTLPALGAGNTNAAVALHGFYI